MDEGGGRHPGLSFVIDGGNDAFEIQQPPEHFLPSDRSPKKPPAWAGGYLFPVSTDTGLLIDFAQKKETSANVRLPRSSTWISRTP